MWSSRGIREVLSALPPVVRARVSILVPIEECRRSGGCGYVDSRNWDIGSESIMYLEVGKWWIAGTVYFPFAVEEGVMPLYIAGLGIVG